MNPKADGPFQIIAQQGDNACVLDLPATYGVSLVFNIRDLGPYHGNAEWRAIHFQEGGNEPSLGFSLEGVMNHETHEATHIEPSLPSQSQDKSGHQYEQKESAAPLSQGESGQPLEPTYCVHGLSKKGPRVSLYMIGTCDHQN